MASQISEERMEEIREQHKPTGMAGYPQPICFNCSTPKAAGTGSGMTPARVQSVAVTARALVDDPFLSEIGQSRSRREGSPGRRRSETVR